MLNWSVVIEDPRDPDSEAWIESHPMGVKPTRFNTNVEFLLEDVDQLRSFTYLLCRINNWEEFEGLRDAAAKAISMVKE